MVEEGCERLRGLLVPLQSVLVAHSLGLPTQLAARPDHLCVATPMPLALQPLEVQHDSTSPMLSHASANPFVPTVGPAMQSGIALTFFCGSNFEQGKE